MTTARTELEAMSDAALAGECEAAANELEGIGLPTAAAAQREVARRLRERAWIPVSERLPVCSLEPGSTGVEVLIYPPIEGRSAAFFGCRLDSARRRTGRFYYAGSQVHGVKFWQPLPPLPRAEEPKHG